MKLTFTEQQQQKVDPFTLKIKGIDIWEISGLVQVAQKCNPQKLQHFNQVLTYLSNDRKGIWKR